MYNMFCSTFYQRGMESLEGEDYWCDSVHKGFNFDEDTDTIDTTSIQINKWDVLSDECTDRTINFNLSTIVSSETLKGLLEEQCIIDECTIPKGMTSEDELKLLRRQIQSTLYSPSPEITAYKLLLGKIPPLEIFKSLEEKEKLLDSIYQNGGGDAIISVLLFLKRTLSKEKFYEILGKRPDALQQYLSFLQSCNNSKEEALQLLTHFGRHQEALTMQFELALMCKDIDQQKSQLKKLLDTYSAFNINGVYMQKVHNTVKLLELIEKDHNSLDNKINLHSTPIEILYACCQKHSNWKDPNLTCNISPFRLCAEQHISPAQFEWTALNERTRSQAYADLESIFERVPTWHPIKQKMFHINISLESAILRLHFLKAPQSVLYLFLSKMPNTLEKVKLSRRVSSIKAQIDAFAGIKDTAELTKLRDNLPDRSEEKFYCDKVLKQLQNKRWSTENIKLKL